MADVKKEATPAFPAAPKADGKPKGPMPRVCRQLERAELGLKRFRIRALGDSPTGTVKKVGLYILAPNRVIAESYYLEVEQADLVAAGYLTPLKNDKGETLPAKTPLLDVLELAD